MASRIACAFTLLVLVAGACDPRDRVDAQPDRIVLVTIDTLRADHLGSYGYPRATSPFIDSLAERGVRFERAVTSMSTTAPAHASLFTGLYPLEHGVTMNGHRLRADPATMAERLRAAGYRTAGFASTSSHFGPGGLDRGFQDFDEPGADLGTRPARQTIDAALGWLASREPDERFFLWIHLFDPHRSLTPPESSVRELRELDPVAPEALAEFLIDEQRVESAFYGGDRRMLMAVMDAYDAAIRYADAELRRLYSRAQELGLGARALWVITSDHGEGLGNHGWMGHGRNIYNEQLRVPLIFYFSDRPVGPIAVGTLVESVDVPPTLLELVGLDAIGRGVSLVPLLAGAGDSVADKPAFSQRRTFAHPVAEEGDSLARRNYEAGEKYAVQRGGYKYLLRTRGNDELYHLDDDPYETRNLVGSGLREEAMLRALLLEWIARPEHQNAQPPLFVDDEVAAGLRGLGYVR